MAEPRGLPAGRSGRMWLRRRLATAERGAALLDRKLRILRAEEARLRPLAEAAAERWAQAYAPAQEWLVRVAVLGGQREVRLAAAVDPARTRMTWSTVMGVRYPATVEVVPTDSGAASRAAGTAATAPAVAAYAVALDAALEQAVAAEALRAVEAEVRATAQRLRAISDRWIPHLRSALDTLTQRLEETERDETTRLRWAADRSGRSPAVGHIATQRGR